MCRSIKTLRGAAPAAEDEVRAAALQFVRKISGCRAPSAVNRAGFDAAVEEITAVSERLLLEWNTPRSSREAAALPR